MSMTREATAGGGGGGAAHRHGMRLACFRPLRRFSVDGAGHDARPVVWNPLTADGSKSGTTERQPLACDCESQVLQCHFAAGAAQSDADAAQVEELCLARLRRWTERFGAHDWKHERVCQKWKENQQRFTQEQAAAENAAAPGEDEGKRSPSKAVREAFSNLTSAAEVLILSRQFDNLLRAGVPPQLRGQVWWMCSGAADKKAAADESYAQLVARRQYLSKSAVMDIEKDLPRTFPVDLSQSQDLGASAGLTAASGVWENDRARRRNKSISELRRVLQAYSVRNPAIGYCQSMNFLAAVLLHQMEEEEAFWVLVAIVEELTPQYHTRSMSGSRADQRVFSDLVQQKLPALYHHMQRLGVDFEPFTLKWFLCLFLNTLPFEPVMRIWDVFFCEGSHVLLRVGLALLKLNQPRILACDDAFDVYELFKLSHDMLQSVTAPYRSGLLNRDECVCDTLLRLAMDKSFVGPIPPDWLHELRVYYRNEIETELGEVDARRLEHRSQRTSSGSSVASTACRVAPVTTSSRGSVTSAALVDEDDKSDDAGETSSSGSGTDRERQEYDFVDEYAGRDSEISPSKHIHFLDLYDSDDAIGYFIDVKFDLSSSLAHYRSA